jgi:CheY-like chemotaxis protein/anti-sigma regulatory factor (Ser/Thr protein kinase)
MASVLIVDDSALDRRLAGGLLDKSPSLVLRYADNGREALQQMQHDLPDVVVCDLQMPEMDGLELVEAIRNRYPLVPVILMTAHGNEDIAVQALKRGAASYVPKTSLARDLLDTVENVLAVARADRRVARLRDCLVSTEATFELGNDPALIPAMVDHLQEYVMRTRLCDETGRIRVGIALEEALLNALYHGNLELTTEQLRVAQHRPGEAAGRGIVEQRCTSHPYKDRRIFVYVRATPWEVEYLIRDEGPGFQTDLTSEPTDLVKVEQEGGRGLMLMRTFMDEVSFNAAGNEVRMVKRREVPAAGGRMQQRAT